jgi:hypothetical protein
MVRIARDGRIEDTLALQHWPLKNFGLAVAPQRSVGVRKPFPDHPLYAASRDGTGIIMVDRSVDQQYYTLAKIGLRGDTSYIRRFECTSRQPTSDLVSRAVSRIQETVSQHFARPTATTVRAALNDKELIPRTLPPITALASGSDGTIWLRREDSLDPMVPWHVMDQAGQPIAVVFVPAGETVMAVNDRFIATLQEDALDVPYVTVYALQKPER